MLHNFESGALERANISHLHKEAVRVIERSRVKETDFIGRPYKKEDVMADIAKVESLEAKFKAGESEKDAEMKMVADIFEAIVLEHGELSEWFGRGAITKKTSRFDDYTNGVDVIIEFNEEEGGETTHLGLAADVTFTTDTTDKFSRLIKNIDDGMVPEVKYSEVDHIPEVIIGVHKNMVLELAELAAERKNKILAVHRVQIMILRQIEAQLDAFAHLAESKDNHGLANLYRDRLEIVSSILAQKIEIEKQVKYDIGGDPVHEQIMDFTKRLKQSVVLKAA